MKKLPPRAADSWAASPTAVDARKAVPWTESAVGSGKSTAGATRAPFTCVSAPASHASTITTFASAAEEATSAFSSSYVRVSGPSSRPPGPAWPE